MIRSENQQAHPFDMFLPEDVGNVREEELDH